MQHESISNSLKISFYFYFLIEILHDNGENNHNAINDNKNLINVYCYVNSAAFNNEPTNVTINFEKRKNSILKFPKIADATDWVYIFVFVDIYNPFGSIEEILEISVNQHDARCKATSTEVINMNFEYISFLSTDGKLAEFHYLCRDKKSLYNYWWIDAFNRINTNLLVWK